MNTAVFTEKLESKVTEQLRSQRVGYLLGAGSSYLDGLGYPLAFEVWDQIKNLIGDVNKRDEIQAKLDLPGTKGIEHALDLLDDGGPEEGEHRHLVAAAIADLFVPLVPLLDSHIEFVKRLTAKAVPHVQVFNLNYDPLIEHARKRNAIRRGGNLKRATLGDHPAQQNDVVDQIALNKTINALRERSSRQALVVEYRYYLGFSVPQVAEELQVSPRTVDTDWKHAKAWIRRELTTRA